VAVTFSFEYELCFERKKMLHVQSRLNSENQRNVCQKKQWGQIFFFINSGSDLQKTEHRVRKAITDDIFFSPLL
jgi:hypothetical protein